MLADIYGAPAAVELDGLLPGCWPVKCHLQKPAADESADSSDAADGHARSHVPAACCPDVSAADGHSRTAGSDATGYGTEHLHSAICGARQCDDAADGHALSHVPAAACPDMSAADGHGRTVGSDATVYGAEHLRSAICGARQCDDAADGTAHAAVPMPSVPHDDAAAEHDGIIAGHGAECYDAGGCDANGHDARRHDASKYDATSHGGRGHDARSYDARGYDVGYGRPLRQQYDARWCHDETNFLIL